MDFVKLEGDLKEPRSVRRQKGIVVKAGDLVIIMERHDQLSSIYATPGTVLQNRFGAFRHDDIIGKPFGSKVTSRGTGKYVHILAPTPELWASSLKHRTQICHEMDQSMVVFQLGLKAGDVVVESGTGSGAMSTAIMRAIAPTGHLHTLEFNATRAQQARDEFAQNGLGHLVTVYTGDVCERKTGLDDALAPVVASLAGTVDAVFWDLPDPWKAIGLARELLKPNCPIATYSPCIEQVFKTCEALKMHKFHSLRTLEVRQMSYDVRKVKLEEVDFGDDQAVVEETEAVADGAIVGEAIVGDAAEGGAAIAAASGDATDVMDVSLEVDADAQEPHKTSGAEGPDPASSNTKKGAKRDRAGKAKRGREDSSSVCATRGDVRPLPRPRHPMRGHTAFLTFAVKGLVPPKFANAKSVEVAVVSKGGSEVEEGGKQEKHGGEAGADERG